MNEWITQLQSEFREIMFSSLTLCADEFIPTLMDTFSNANTCYKHIFAHKEMFEDFLCCLNTAEAQAAVILLRRLVKRNMEYSISLKDHSLYFIPKEQKRSRGRLQIKRYLAIMGNRQLRKILFGF